MEHAPTSRYRDGARDDEARAAHTDASREWRRQVGDAIFTPGVRTLLLDAVADRVPLAQVADALGISYQAVHGYAARYPEFADALDQACRDAAPLDTRHGTPGGYRHGGCRCRDCRAAHHPAC